MPPRQADRTGKVITATLGMKEEDIITKVLQYIPDRDQEQAQLAFADFIVAGGRGLGKPENFRLVEDLAGVMVAAR